MPTTEGTESKVVQTELSEEEYDRLRRLAEQEGASLKRILREAATEYVARHLRYQSDDPLFDVTPGTGTRETDARETDAYLTEAFEADTNDRE